MYPRPDPTPEYSEEKLQELIVYLALRSADDPAFGAVKLNKLLFYSDFGFYSSTGRSITGAEYQRLPHGPAPRRLVPVRDTLISKGRVAMQKEQVFMRGRERQRLVALTDPDLTRFTGEEIAFVNKVLDLLSAQNGAQVSELSHEEPGWKLATDGETIPYFSVVLSSAPRNPTSDELRWAEATALRFVDAARM